MSFPPFTFTVLDTETTGVTPGSDRIIEIALVRYEGGKEVSRFSSLVSFGGELPALTQAITQITPEDLLEKPALKEIWEEVNERCRGAVIVGHNVGFDLAMLKAEGFLFDSPATLDTALLASLAFPEERSWGLEALSISLTLPHNPPHRALGDVLATASLLGRIVERLEELPSSLLKEAAALAARGSPGMNLLFSSLQSLSSSETLPLWTQGVRSNLGGERRDLPSGLRPSGPNGRMAGGPRQLKLTVAGREVSPQQGVRILEVPLGFSPWDAIVRLPSSERTWIAVRSVRQTLERHGIPEQVTILHFPTALVDRTTFQDLQRRPRLTDAELLLALKGKWISSPHRHDLAIYGDQGAISLGLLAATPESSEYTDQFRNLGGTVLLDHAHLLQLLGQDALPKPAASDHIIIADAGSFENSASHAYGVHIYTDFLRAGDSSEPHQKLTDLLEVFMQSVRGSEQSGPLLPQHLNLKEVAPLKRLMEGVLQKGVASPHIEKALRSLLIILDEKYLPSAITWVKLQPNGGQTLHSEPRDLRGQLKQDVFSQHSVTLLSPPQSPAILSPILSVSTPPVPLPSSLAREMTVETPAGSWHDLFKKDVKERIVLLLPSRRVLEECFCRYVRPLEERGVRLLVQGLSGSSAKLEGEFVKNERTILAVTAWTYEKKTLPAASADTLIIDRLPFDHPGDIVLQERGKKFMNSFEEYQLPRLFARLFRILDNFSLQAKEGAKVMILDERMQTKRYGQQILAFLRSAKGVCLVEKGAG